MLVHDPFSLLYCMGMCVAEKGVYGSTRAFTLACSGSGGHLVHGGGKSPHRGATAWLFFRLVIFNEV